MLQQNELKKLDEKLQTELRLRRAGRDEPSEDEMRDLLARHDAEKRHLLAARAADKAARDARLRDKLNNGRKNTGNVGEVDGDTDILGDTKRLNAFLCTF